MGEQGRLNCLFDRVAIDSMVALVLFLRVWQPKKVWTSVSLKGHETDSGEAKAVLPITPHSRADLIRAWTPWVILTLFEIGRAHV